MVSSSSCRREVPRTVPHVPGQLTHIPGRPGAWAGHPLSITARQRLGDFVAAKLAEITPTTPRSSEPGVTKIENRVCIGPLGLKGSIIGSRIL